MPATIGGVTADIIAGKARSYTANFTEQQSGVMVVPACGDGCWQKSPCAEKFPVTPAPDLIFPFSVLFCRTEANSAVVYYSAGSPFIRFRLIRVIQ